jgi:predicted LPLAT superfamily acyltransferase
VRSRLEAGVTSAGTPRPSWTVQPERGSMRGMRSFGWLALRVGRRAARMLLYPICVYFVLFSIVPKAASRNYLRKVLAREPRLADLFKHYYAFASMTLDRVFLLHGEYSGFDIRVHNEALVAEPAARGKGCFLVGAHMGSFEVSRALGSLRHGLGVSMVMYEENVRKLNGALEALNPGADVKIIALGRVDTMLKIENALEAGEFVGMLADRTIEGEGSLRRTFLGEAAQFPLGPFRLAALLERPLILMLGLYHGGNRYDIYFESLGDVHGSSREERNAALEQALSRYVERLEHYCRLAPYNWFNFYDFWK